MLLAVRFADADRDQPAISETGRYPPTIVRTRPETVTTWHFAAELDNNQPAGGGMWKELGATIREAMINWGTTVRLCVLLSVLTLSTIAIMWASTR